MNAIYLDNAATTFPKPACVADAVYKYMTNIGSNINRGGYGRAYKAEELVYDTRVILAELFGGSDPKRVIFTKNVTESLNVILKGLLKKSDHVIVSSMEHNAVMRPLTQIGCGFTRVPCDSTGELILNSFSDCLRENTKAVVMTHASNVTGTVMPIEAVGKFCHEHGLIFIVDTAQTAGVLNIDMEASHIDALAFTGHKGLMAPQGIGGFVLADGLEDRIEPLISGGTGSFSHTEDVPRLMPDRFEAGTMNIPGIAGLREGLLWLRETGISEVHSRELALTERFLAGLSELESGGLLRVYGRRDTENRVGVVSIGTGKAELSDAAYRLDSEYGIMTRVGLHCAPSAHKTIGTFPKGTIRFSFGWFNTESDSDTALTALREILEE